MGLDVAVPQIKLRPISALARYENNSRTHSPAQIEVLQRMMQEYGFTNPVLIDEMGIVAGHGRCMAAEEVYKRGEQLKFPDGTPIPIGHVPTLDVSGWSTEQRRAYIIADNQTALMAGWDEEMLRIELSELAKSDFDLTLTAFDEDTISALLATTKAPEQTGDPDAAPGLEESHISQPGDVWVCGPHRVMCGSSLNIEDWDRLMQGERADACFTDPPYNVDVGRKNALIDKTDGGSRSKTGAIANDKLSDEDFRHFLREAFASLFAQLKPGAPIYVAHTDSETINFCTAFKDAGFHQQSVLIWKKDRLVLGFCDWQTIHEPILYGYKRGARHRWYGGRKNTSVIDLGDTGPFQRLEDGRYQIKIGDNVLIVSAGAVVDESPTSVLYEPKPQQSGLHPTQKPVALIERLLRQSARPGDLVVDAFGGSGSTLVAADRLGMSSRLMELDPRFVDVIVRRWQTYTGRQAVHAKTGMAFDGDGNQAPPASAGDTANPLDLF